MTIENVLIRATFVKLVVGNEPPYAVITPAFIDDRPCPRPREAAPPESLHLGSPHRPWSWSALPSAPRPAQGRKCGRCLENKHSSGHLQPHKQRPWSSWSYGSPGQLLHTHTRTPGTRTSMAHTGDPTPRCGQTGVSSSTCSWSPGHRPPASLFRELCSLSLWGRQVSNQPLMGRGP